MPYPDEFRITQIQVVLTRHFTPLLPPSSVSLTEYRN